MEALESHQAFIIEYIQNHPHITCGENDFDENFRNFIVSTDALLIEDAGEVSHVLQRAFDVLSSCASFFQSNDEFTQSAALLWKYYGKRFVKFSNHLSQTAGLTFSRVFQSFCCEGISSIMDNERDITNEIADPLLEQKLKFVAFFLQRLIPTVSQCKQYLEHEQIAEVFRLVLEYYGLLNFFNTGDVESTNLHFYYSALIRIGEESPTNDETIRETNIQSIYELLLKSSFHSTNNEKRMLFQRNGTLKFLIELLMVLTAQSPDYEPPKQYYFALFMLLIREVGLLSELVHNPTEDSMLAANLSAVGELVVSAMSVHKLLELWDLVVMLALGYNLFGDGDFISFSQVVPVICNAISGILLNSFQDHVKHHLFVRGWKIMCSLSFQPMNGAKRLCFISHATNFVATCVAQSATARKSVVSYLEKVILLDQSISSQLCHVSQEIVESLCEKLLLHTERSLLLLPLIENRSSDVLKLIMGTKQIHSTISPALILCESLGCRFLQGNRAKIVEQYRQVLSSNLELGTGMVKVIQALARQLENYASNDFTVSQELGNKVAHFLHTITSLLHILSIYELPSSIIQLLEQFNQCCNKCILWLGKSMLISSSSHCAVVSAVAESVACSASFLQLFAATPVTLMKDCKDNFQVINQIFLSSHANARLWKVHFAVVQFVEDISQMNVPLKLKLEPQALFVKELQPYVEFHSHLPQSFFLSCGEYTTKWSDVQYVEQNGLWCDKLAWLSNHIIHQLEFNQRYH